MESPSQIWSFEHNFEHNFEHKSPKRNPLTFFTEIPHLDKQTEVAQLIKALCSDNRHRLSPAPPIRVDPSPSAKHNLASGYV